MPSAEKEPPRTPTSDSARRSGIRSLGPARLGKYDLIARIGKGGMAQVYLARQRGPANFEKIVVVKTIHPHLAAKESFIDMLLDEARIAALLKHPCVVDIYDLGLDEETYFIAMEYLSGEPLLSVLRAGRVKERPLDIHSTCRIIADVADGLHAAHELRDNAGHHLELVHRDVTPGNIVVLYNGQVKIVDFGIAKARGRLAGETDARKLKGKLGYVSPEQIRGQSSDRRADIFALGVVMWEALTYRRLFRGNNPGTVLAAIVKEKLQPPSAVRKEIPPQLDAIVMRALARNPEERYPTAQEMHSDLETFLTGAGALQQRKTIATYMQEVFAEQIQERARILREMHESNAAAAAGPKDAMAAFAIAATDEDDDEGSPRSKESSSEDLEAGARPAAAAGDARRPATPPPSPQHTPADGLTQSGAASITPANLLPNPPSAELGSERRASSLSVGSSGEVAATRSAEAAAMLRRRWRIAAIAGGVAALFVLVFVLQDDAPPEAGSGASERLFAAASGGDQGGQQAVEPGTAPGQTVTAAAAPDAGAATADTPTEPTTPTEPAVDDPAAGAEEEGDEIEIAGQGAATAGDRRNPTTRTENAQMVTERPRPANPGTERPRPVEPGHPRDDGRAARKRAETLYQEGATLFVKGQLLAAQLKFREAQQLAPTYAPAYRGMGLVHQASGQRKQAARAYRQYLRLSPGARDRAEILARIEQVEQ
jgi:serine/threonine protein kinase